jgi:hypothetical protein
VDASHGYIPDMRIKSEVLGRNQTVTLLSTMHLIVQKLLALGLEPGNVF